MSFSLSLKWESKWEREDKEKCTNDVECGQENRLREELCPLQLLVWLSFIGIATGVLKHRTGSYNK